MEKNWAEKGEGGSAAPDPEDVASTVEDSDHCGMGSRHTLTGLVLVETETKDEWGVQYHWICSLVRFIAARGIVFQFASEEGVYEVEITGDGSTQSVESLRRIARKLSWGKRALIWANGVTVRAVEVVKQEEPEEED